MVAIAAMLLRYSARFDLQRADGRTPLHLAAKGGHDVVMRSLLSQEADPNTKDEAGETPFSLAFYEAHVTCCAFLVGNGAEVQAMAKGAGWIPPYTDLEPHEHQSMRASTTKPMPDNNSGREFDLIGC